MRNVETVQYSVEVRSTSGDTVGVRRTPKIQRSDHRTDMSDAAVPIKECRVCGGKKFAKVLSLGNQFVSDFVTVEGQSPRAPLELVRCSVCGLVQLRHTFPRTSLYKHYWYRSGISGTMRDALSDITARAVEIAKPRSGDVVLDIGCNDGTLLRSYKVSGLQTVGFEPAENLVPDARKDTTFIFNDFFNAAAFKKEFGKTKARIITCAAMFYDLENPNSFVVDIVECLGPKGIWVIQQNYLSTMLEQNGFDNIGHEHLEYYSLATMRHLLRRYGLDVFDVDTNDVNGGSFRTCVARVGDYPMSERVKEMEQYEKQLGLHEPHTYQMFSQRIRKIRDSTRQFVNDALRHGKKVYVYGASNRGNTILQYCGLDHTLIKKATDANPEKWGRKTVGTLIPIVSKDEARKDKPDYFLVLPHHFLGEIIREEESYLNAGGRFIVPLPEFKIVSKDDA